MRKFLRNSEKNTAVDRFVPTAKSVADLHRQVTVPARHTPPGTSVAVRQKFDNRSQTGKD